MFKSTRNRGLEQSSSRMSMGTEKRERVHDYRLAPVSAVDLKVP